MSTEMGPNNVPAERPAALDALEAFMSQAPAVSAAIPPLPRRHVGGASADDR